MALYYKAVNFNHENGTTNSINDIDIMIGALFEDEVSFGN